MLPYKFSILFSSHCIHTIFITKNTHSTYIRHAFDMHSTCIRYAFAMYSTYIRHAFDPHSTCIQHHTTVHSFDNCTIIRHTFDQFADKYPLRWYNEIVNTFQAGKSRHKLEKMMLKNCSRHKLKK